MDHQPALVSAGLLLLILLFAVVSTSISTYEQFHLVESGQEGRFCEQYQAQCICVGSLAMNATYPPGYACDGYQVCRNINRTVCPAGP